MAAAVPGRTPPAPLRDRPAGTHIRRGGAAGLLAILFLLIGWGIRPPGAAQAGMHRGAPPACFTTGPGPNPGRMENTLTAVDGVSPSDVWAVGYAGDGDAVTSLTAHWDGQAWTPVPSPNPGHRTLLQGVYAAGAADAWAVGNADGAALLLHYTTGGWAALPSPSAGLLYAVRGTSGSDLWAVGETDTTTAQVLILHGDGTRWTPSPAPALAQNSVLYGVSPLAPDNVWAVGTTWVGSRYSTLLLHWNGTSWSQIPSPDPGTSGSLYSTAALNAQDVWAVGSMGSQSLTLHWDGTNWQQIPSPSPGSLGTILYGVSATTAGGVWSAGEVDTPGGPQTLILRWDGTAWQSSASPNPSGTLNILTGISAIGADAVWAVGYLAQGSATATLILQSCGGPPPSATATVGATATPCTVRFADVPPDAYFATPVADLACHGIVSGYGDGTYRPYQTTTRGQIVKLIVLGFGLAPAPMPGGDYFADVPPTHPFYPYVEAAAQTGLISGYACGGPGEPCDSRARPYFRPARAITRGQLSKILVEATGWPLLNPAAGTFADVPPESPFYPFVETAACRGTISGYACGGPGEPCDLGGQPYFRPSTTATRGQVAKVVFSARMAAGAACPTPESRP